MPELVNSCRRDNLSPSLQRSLIHRVQLLLSQYTILSIEVGTGHKCDCITFKWRKCSHDTILYCHALAKTVLHSTYIYRPQPLALGLLLIPTKQIQQSCRKRLWSLLGTERVKDGEHHSPAGKYWISLSMIVQAWNAEDYGSSACKLSTILSNASLILRDIASF